MNLSESGRTSRIRLSAPSSLVSSTRSNDSSVFWRMSLSLIRPAPWIRPTGSPYRRAPAVEDAGQGPRVAHVGLGIGDGRAGLAQDLEVLANLPGPAEGLVDRFDLGGAARPALVAQPGVQRRLDLGLSVQARRVG